MGSRETPPGGEPESAAAVWDERYSAPGHTFGTRPNEFVVEMVAGLPPGRALDVACGEGRHAVWLAARGHEVTGVDVSPVAIAKAGALAVESGVSVDLVIADLAAYEPAAGAYDLVLLAYVQLPDALRRTVHVRAAAALAPGGTLALVAHHRDNLERGIGGPPTVEVLFDEEQLLADFASLSVARCEEVLRVVAAGTPEQATAVDVVCVATGPGDS